MMNSKNVDIDTQLPAKLEPAASQFREKAVAMGLNPDDRFVGGYAQYEMDHLRHILRAYGIDVQGKTVLEFGCNVGASAVVLQHLGARVVAIDISADNVELARLNGVQYGLSQCDYRYMPDTRVLPFADGQFDLVFCSSVLEYVSHESLAAIQRELARVTAKQGTLLVLGTSSRAWPKEVHSGRWFVNYLPYWIDRFIGFPEGLQRGASPWALRRGFGDDFENLDIKDRGSAFRKSRQNFVPSSTPKLLPIFSAVANILGIGVGTMLPNFSCILRKK
jgi:SAM-dependent methyltransferase